MTYRFAVAAIAISGASAQLVPYPGPESSSTPPSPPPYTTPASSPPVSSVSSSTPASYVTVTYSDCPSQSIETLITVTNGVTVTYCPECHHTPGPSHTTVYTTVYQSLCSTGLVPATYTVTEECAEETPTWAATKEHHVPPGFTVTVKECHVCDKTPVPVTITEPCHDGCGKPTPPPAPTGEASQPPSGGMGSNMPAGPSGSGSSPPAGGNGGANRPPASPEDEHCPGPQCSHPAGGSPAGGSAPGGTPPYPTAGGDDSCPGGAHCPHGTGAPSPGNSSTPQSYTGGAVGSSFGLVSSIFMAVAVAALAFAL